MSTSAFADRPLKKLVLFDVDGTLTPARRVRLGFDPAVMLITLPPAYRALLLR